MRPYIHMRWFAVTPRRISFCLYRIARHPGVWAVIIAYVAAVGWQVGTVGLRLREDVWTESRTLRFTGDISNAYRWGGEVLQAARNIAEVPAHPSIFDIMRGESAVYRRVMGSEAPDNFQLDYPPGRLFVMALWRRHVEADQPKLTQWPAKPDFGRSRGDPASTATEDVAWPLLNVNTAMEGASALLAAALVALWVWRSADRKSKSTAGTITADGVPAFMVCATALFYALCVAVYPSPAPPPAVTLAVPTVRSTADATTAIVHANISPQGATTQWQVKWGTEAGYYTRATPMRPIGSMGTQDVSAELSDLPAKSVVHYSVVARNDYVRMGDSTGRGTTHTDDATLVVDEVIQPKQPGETFGAVWLNLPQWMGVAVVFIAMCWSLRRMDTRHRAWAAATVTGVLIWFNPVLLVNAHVWPQWDVWVIAPYLLAALLASLDWWLTAGLVIGASVLFKGQFLIGAPVLLFWPMLGGRWREALRMLIGAALVSGLLLSPFIVLGGRAARENPLPLLWIAGAIGAAIIGGGLSLLRRPVVAFLTAWWHVRKRRSKQSDDESADQSVERSSWRAVGVTAVFSVIAVGAAALFLFYVWPADATLHVGWGVLILALLLIVPWAIRRRTLGIWGAAVAAMAIWLSAMLFHGDWSWMSIGYEYGANKYDVAATGSGSNGNLGLILGQRFDWNPHDPAVTLRLPNFASLLFAGSPADRVPSWLHACSLDGTPLTLDLKQTMIGVYVTLLLACGIGAANHARRRDPRILAALIGPWAAMPSTLCQMMTRYHLWGVVMSAMLVGVAAELAVLSVAVTLLAAGMVGNQLLEKDASRSPQLHALFTTLSPDSGWLMLAGAAIVIYLALVPGPPRSERNGETTKQGRVET